MAKKREKLQCAGFQVLASGKKVGAERDASGKPGIFCAASDQQTCT